MALAAVAHSTTAPPRALPHTIADRLLAEATSPSVRRLELQAYDLGVAIQFVEAAHAVVHDDNRGDRLVSLQVMLERRLDAIPVASARIAEIKLRQVLKSFHMGVRDDRSDERAVSDVLRWLEEA